MWNPDRQIAAARKARREAAREWAMRTYAQCAEATPSCDGCGMCAACGFFDCPAEREVSNLSARELARYNHMRGDE